MFSRNRDRGSVTEGEASQGARLGFLGALEAAYDETARYHSQVGAQYYTQQEEAENIRRITEAGGKAPTPLMTVDEALDNTKEGIYDRLVKALYDFDDDALMPILGDRDEQLRELQRQFPDAGIKTYGEMFRTVQEGAQKARLRGSRQTTWGGVAGSFIGGTAGALDPRVNPWNFWTLPVGGVGRTAVGRIATQGGAQGGIEAVSQFTGVQENQRRLGGDPTLTDALVNIGAVAAGGAALQGVVEGGVALGRRWFRNTPDDPAPPLPTREETTVQTPPQRTAVPPQTQRAINDAVADMIGPLARSRAGLAAAGRDFDHVRSQIDAWDGPPPWQVGPPTLTRAFEAPEPTARVDLPIPERADLARAVDPETFRVVDNIMRMQEQLRAVVRSQRAEVEPSVRAARDTIDDQIAVKRDQRGQARTKQQRAKIDRELADLETQAARMAEEEGVTVAEARSALMKLDEQLRDLAPAVSRAFAQSEGKWTSSQATNDAIREMMGLPPRQPSAKGVKLPDEIPELTPMQRADYVPEMRGNALLPGEDKTTGVQRIAAQQLERLDAEATALREAARARLKAIEDGEVEIAVGGEKLHVDNDVIYIEAPDGSTRPTTVRGLLKEADADDATMKALQTCSVVKTS